MHLMCYIDSIVAKLHTQCHLHWHWIHICLLVSNICIPCFTLDIISAFVSLNNLSSSAVQRNFNKLVSAVGGSKLICHDWVPTTFCINNQQTNQLLFICDKNNICFSKKFCIVVNIVPSSFPHPVNTDTTKISTVTTNPY